MESMGFSGHIRDGPLADIDRLSDRIFPPRNYVGQENIVRARSCIGSARRRVSGRSHGFESPAC